MSSPSSLFPSHWGATFTQTLHSKAEGPTAPENNRVHGNFVVCITGASKGLGYHVALAYAKAGAKGIVASARSKASLDELSSEINKISPDTKVVVQQCDAMVEADVRRLAEVTQSNFGRVDVVVANAGIISTYVERNDGKLYQPNGVVEDGDFEKVIQTNLMGCYRVAKHFVPLLQQTTDGVQAFVGISSVASHFADSEWCPLAYNLSKLGINRLVEQIHHDYNGKYGLQAFAIHPGAVVTPQTVNHHTTQLGSTWDSVLTDDIGLCGGFLTWLTSERHDWLSGRYVSVTWDVNELLAKKDEIVESDKLTFKMTV